METLNALLALISTQWIGAVVGIVVVFVLVVVINKLTSKAGQIKHILQVLKIVENVIKSMIPDKWEPVYDAVIDAVGVVVAEKWDVESAKENAKAIFNQSMLAANVNLSEVEKVVIGRIIDMLVGMVVKDVKMTSSDMVKIKALAIKKEEA